MRVYLRSNHLNISENFVGYKSGCNRKADLDTKYNQYKVDLGGFQITVWVLIKLIYLLLLLLLIFYNCMTIMSPHRHCTMENV